MQRIKEFLSKLVSYTPTTTETSSSVKAKFPIFQTTVHTLYYLPSLMTTEKTVDAQPMYRRVAINKTEFFENEAFEVKNSAILVSWH